MARKIPSGAQLNAMSKENAWATLSYMATEIRSVIDGLETNSFQPVGRTKTSLLSSEKRRLKRIEQLAQERGLYVGPSDAENPLDTILPTGKSLRDSTASEVAMVSRYYSAASVMHTRLSAELLKFSSLLPASIA